ncbi:RHS repeat-associated core domain-containing protein [Pseudomonas alloputida]|uniref:RHS repeat-associated core domain-containing protein n=1 Tax=Pseudomonas TaxID=286 RepID=UPI003EEB0D09
MRRACLLVTDRQRSAWLGSGTQSSSKRIYSPYGYAPSVFGPLAAFAGQRHDPLTGCYHLGNGHRLYGPGLMRFLNPDHLSPFGQGGINTYAYCAGDPVNNVDPSGKFLAALASIEVTRATTVAAYTGLNLAALTSRIQSRSALWANRQLMFETVMVVTGVGMLFSGSQRLQPAALGMMSLGNVSSIIKSTMTIKKNVASGVRHLAGVVAQNIRYLSGYEQLSEPHQAVPAPTPPLPSTHSGHVVINVNPGVVHIGMSRSPSPVGPVGEVRSGRRHSTGSVESTKL